MKRLIFLFALLFSFGANAQTVLLKWKQIQAGSQGQVAIVGVDGKGQWVTPPFLNMADTAAMLAAYRAKLHNLDASKQNYSDTTSFDATRSWVNTNKQAFTDTSSWDATKSYVNTAVSTKQNYSDTTGFDATKSWVNNQISTKADVTYVDNLVTGLKWKQAVVAATTGNINISSPGGTIDGVSLSNGQRVLVKNQTNAAQNGIYIFNGASNSMTRATDMDNWTEVPGAAVFVNNGTQNEKTGWVVAGVPEAGTIGTTDMDWTQFTGAGTYAATSPIVLTGNTFSHATSGVSAGTYTSVTVDDKGHVTGGSNPGFITTEVDPIFTNHDAYSITSTDMSNWTAAYNDRIVSASVTGTTTKTITLTQQDGGTVTANWTDLQSQWTDAAEQFTGSTSNTINLSAAPSTQKHLTVSLNGQILTASDYSVSGTTLTLSNINRESDDYIIVYYSY